MAVTKYTTIQVRQDFANVIREFCRTSGRKISPTTEIAWSNYITASVSGSYAHVTGT